jgi:beta-carotene 3-hydroxylase
MTDWLLISVVFIASFLFMEGVAWSNHKYLMHGILWVLHRDHHENARRGTRKLEKNDLFFIIYAIPAAALLISGFAAGIPWEIAAGAGFSVYGMVNFTIHDIIYHKRLPLFRNFRNSFVNAAIRAHDAHHNPASPDDFRNFGLLIFPLKYFK